MESCPVCLTPIEAGHTADYGERLYVNCPACGHYQAAMVKMLRRRLGGSLGSDYDPNRYARERIAMSRGDAWRAACVANTTAAYNDLLKIWPVYYEAIQDRMSALRYPRLKKWASRLGWLVWGAIALIFVIAVLLALFGERHPTGRAASMILALTAATSARRL